MDNHLSPAEVIYFRRADNLPKALANNIQFSASQV